MYNHHKCFTKFSSIKIITHFKIGHSFIIFLWCFTLINLPLHLPQVCSNLSTRNNPFCIYEAIEYIWNSKVKKKKKRLTFLFPLNTHFTFPFPSHNRSECLRCGVDLENLDIVPISGVDIQPSWHPWSQVNSVLFTEGGAWGSLGGYRLSPGEERTPETKGT